MGEVATEPRVLSERRFEVIVPSDPVPAEEGAVATTKEEEWVTKKTTELTTTRQIETRVKRQVVLEDGKVVDDSGPIVTTNTTEDTETQEHKHTEHRTAGDDDDPEPVAVAPGSLVKEVREKVIRSREEKQDFLETEDVKHLGDISDQAYQDAVREGKDLSEALREAAESQQLVPAEGPRIVDQWVRSHKVIDTDDTRKLSELQPDGKVVTETQHTTEREEISREPGDDSHSESEEILKEGSSRFVKTKDQEKVEYLADGVKIKEEMRYLSEDVEGERRGDASATADQEWDSLSTRIRRMRRQTAKNRGLGGVEPLLPTPIDRKDALTKKPLDFDQEEETRKVETSKWLEHHFGSESRSSRESDDDLSPVNNTSFINVTMKSRPIHSSRKPTPMSPVNGVSSPQTQKSYLSKVQTSSRVFVSSPEPDEPVTNGANGYFQGVSEWSERRKGSTPPLRTERVQVLPTGPNHTFTPKSNSPFENTHQDRHGRSSPYDRQDRSSPYNHVNGRTSPLVNGNSGMGSRTPPYVNSHYENKHSRASPYPSNGVGRESPFQSINTFVQTERMNMIRERSRESLLEGNGYSRHSPKHHRWHHDDREENERPEPPPDYSPSPDIEAAPKKVYQRTRFAADIPPANGRQTPPQKTSTSSKIGESFRKLVGRLRASSSERKKKASPVAPPRRGHSRSAATQTGADMQTVQRFYLGEDPFGGSIYGREREYDGVAPARRRHRRDHDDANRTHGSSNSSSLGRLSKSTSRLTHDYSRSSQTLPRKIYDDDGTSPVKKQLYQQRSAGSSSSKTNSTSMINVSIINNTSPLNNGVGPAKPARTYRSNLSRSKSFNVHVSGPEPSGSGAAHLLGERARESSNMFKSNPHLHRLDESPPPLKSPQILASISRSQRDLTDTGSKDKYESEYTKRHEGSFSKSTSNLVNGYSDRHSPSNLHDTKKKLFMRDLRDRAPELFKTLHGNEDTSDLDRPTSKSPIGRLYNSTPIKNGSSSRVLEYSNSFRSSSTSASPSDHGIRSSSSPYRHLNGNERVTSPIGSKSSFTSSLVHTPAYNNLNGTTKSVVRRGSLNDDDYSETVRITSKSDDPIRPSVTNTVQSYSKKTIPTKGGLAKETIESSETTTVTKSRYRGNNLNGPKYLDNKYSHTNGGGVVIEVRPRK